MANFVQFTALIFLLRNSVIIHRGPLDSTWHSVRANNQRAALQNLESGTQYTFQVAPIHGDGFEGFRSPQVNFTTCGSKLVRKQCMIC